MITIQCLGGLYVFFKRYTTNRADFQGFAADLFTTLHCPTALVVRTQYQPLAAEQMKLLEEGASVIEWIAIVRPSPKNRALAAGTRRLVATARTHYLGFGTVKTEPIYRVLPGQQRQSSLNAYGSVAPIPQTNGSWSSDFAQTRPLPNQNQQLDTGASPSSSSMFNNNTTGFDWSTFPLFNNTQTPQVTTQPHMQMLPITQVSPVDLSLPLSSPAQGMSLPTQPQTQTQTFGHLPMMPNQMDNWPMSMQNLGQLGIPASASDPYAPSSEGFDMWLASILADGDGHQASSEQGQGQSGYQ
jgi:hypothetical protein